MPGSRGLVRGSQPKRELLPRIAIFCEGKTEAMLLKKLLGMWKIPSATVEVVGQVGVPSTIVKRALERRLSERKGEKLEVWVVFDRDEHPCWEPAIHEAERHAIKLAISNPCFELWGLLLHQDQSAELHRRDAQRLLRDLHPSYDHQRNPYLGLKVVRERFQEAAPRAENLRRRAEEAGDPYGCPVTTFDRLVQRLHDLRIT